MEFEGEFLYDNKFNGKGYDQDGNIIYELINGNGKVKEYWVIGDILFEGEYLNGKKNGKGKECYFRNILLYEGEFLNEKRHGKWKEYDFKDKCSKLKYEGEYLNGERHGKGKEVEFAGSSFYDVEYINGIKIK